MGWGKSSRTSRYSATHLAVMKAAYAPFTPAKCVAELERSAKVIAQTVRSLRNLLPTGAASESPRRLSDGAGAK